MSTPEPTSDRVEELLAGASPADGAERETADLIAELRGLEDEPSPELRARVARIASGAPAQGRRTWRERIPLPALPRLSGPRLALAGGALAAVVIAVIAIPAVNDGGAPQTLSADAVEQSVEAPGDLGADAVGGVAESAPNAVQVEPEAFARERSADGTAGTAIGDGAIPPGPDPGRNQEVRVRTAVQVDGVEGLSGAGSRAMSQVRQLGGFTVSSNFSVPNGDFGTGDLVFKVPSARVEEALEGFAELGAVISQNATLSDLQQQLDDGQVEITRRRERLAYLRGEVAKNPGDAELVRQANLAERRLAAKIEQRKQLLQRARLATIDLHLTTDGPAAVEQEENRFVAAFERSWDRLATVLEWVISAAVFVVPFALLAWLGLALSRNLRRRESQRVMGEI